MKLEFTLQRSFGKARFYPENALGRALLNVTGGRSLTAAQVRTLAEYFEVRIREGRLEPVPFESLNLTKEKES